MDVWKIRIFENASEKKIRWPLSLRMPILEACLDSRICPRSFKKVFLHEQHKIVNRQHNLLILITNDKNYQLLRINTFSDDMNDIPLETTILNNEQMMPTDVIATTRQEKGIYICLIRLNDQKSFRHH